MSFKLNSCEDCVHVSLDKTVNGQNKSIDRKGAHLLCAADLPEKKVALVFQKLTFSHGACFVFCNQKDSLVLFLRKLCVRVCECVRMCVFVCVCVCVLVSLPGFVVVHAANFALTLFQQKRGGKIKRKHCGKTKKNSIETGMQRKERNRKKGSPNDKSPHGQDGACLIRDDSYLGAHHKRV